MDAAGAAALSPPAPECKALTEAAFRRELERLYPDCVIFARKLTRDRERAADAVQEAMVAAMASARRLNSVGSMRPWLFAVVKRRVYSAGSGAASERDKTDSLKAVTEVFGLCHSPQPDERLDAMAALQEQPEAQRLKLMESVSGMRLTARGWHPYPRPVHEEATRDLLRRHFNSLSERQREAVQAVVLDGLGFKAAGKVLKIAIPQVRQRLVSAVAAAGRLEVGGPARDRCLSDPARFGRYRQALDAGHPWITATQRRVLEALVQACGNVSAVTRQLGLSNATVHFHIGRADGFLNGSRRLKPPKPPKPPKSTRLGRPRRQPDVPRWPVLRRGAPVRCIAANSNIIGARFDAAHA